MAYLEELLPEFRKGAKIRQEYRGKDYFIQLKDGLILDSYGSPYKFTAIDLLEDKWEFYQESIDWDYIIKNKCLCWFWDKDRSFKRLGFLEKYSKLYRDEMGNVWGCCKPVCKDEITFYEGKK